MKANWIATAVGCIVMLTGIAIGQEDSSSKAEESETQRPALIIPLEHVPVTEVASSLQQFLRRDDIRIVPLTLSNSLLIAGVEGDDRGVLEDLVRLIDRKPAAVDVDIMIIQSTAPGDADGNAVGLTGDAKEVASNILALQKAGTIKVLERLHLTTIDNQLAQLQVGKSQPMARGMNFARPPGSGRSTPSYTMENVGTQLTASSRVSGDDVLIEIAVEKSWVPETKPTSDSEESSFRPDETQKLQIRSTVRIGKDQAVHIGGMTVNAAGEQSRISAIVTAKIVR